MNWNTARTIFNVTVLAACAGLIIVTTHQARQEEQLRKLKPFVLEQLDIMQGLLNKIDCFGKSRMAQATREEELMIQRAKYTVLDKTYGVEELKHVNAALAQIVDRLNAIKL